MIGFVEIDWNGSIERFRPERPFTICKGLKKFAKGARYDEPKDVVLEQIAEANSKFKLTELQLNFVYQRCQATLGTAIEALGLSNESNVDECVNQWLDQSVSLNDGDDINTLAANIISDLTQKQNNN